MATEGKSVHVEMELPAQAAEVLGIAARKAGASLELYSAVCVCAGLFEHLVANGEHEVANLVARHTKALAAQCGRANVRMATTEVVIDEHGNRIGVSVMEGSREPRGG